MELNAWKDKEITRLYWVTLSIFSHWLGDFHRTNTIACPKLTRIYMLGAACSHSSCFSRLAAGAAQEQLQESLSSSQIDSDNPSMQANDAWIPHSFPRSLGRVQAFHLRVPLLFLIPSCAAKLSKLQQLHQSTGKTCPASRLKQQKCLSRGNPTTLLFVIFAPSVPCHGSLLFYFNTAWNL